MDYWKDIILQWLNCLLKNTSHTVKSMDELRDGMIYYNLINKIKSWNSLEYVGLEKETVLQFLKDEYPRIELNDKNGELKSLCIASLILARLSMEPVFRTSLCTYLSADMQIKVKSILESFYPLGQSITVQDICKTFTLSEVDNFESGGTPEHILNEFLNSPVTKSALTQSDKKIFAKLNEMRKLKADFQTLEYEKSELKEDLKIRTEEVKELKNQLQEALSEIKTLRNMDLISETCECSNKVEDNVNSLEVAYKNEIESLELYVTELQTDNHHLEDEKTKLVDEMKIMKGKYCEMESKYLNNELSLELSLFQLQQRNIELIDLQIKYNEVVSYLKEKSRADLSYECIEVDENIIYETSMINQSIVGETLNCVIEIQLQDAKKEINSIKRKNRYIDSLLTILMEEYNRLRSEYCTLSLNNTEININKEENNQESRQSLYKKYNTCEKELQNNIPNAKLSNSQHCNNITNSEDDEEKSLHLYSCNDKKMLEEINKLEVFIHKLYEEVQKNIYEEEKIEFNESIFKSSYKLNKYKEKHFHQILNFIKTTFGTDIRYLEQKQKADLAAQKKLQYAAVNAEAHRTKDTELQINNKENADVMYNDFMEILKLSWYMLRDAIYALCNLSNMCAKLRKRWSLLMHESKHLSNYKRTTELKQLSVKKYEVQDEIYKISIETEQTILRSCMNITQFIASLTNLHHTKQFQNFHKMTLNNLMLDIFDENVTPKSLSEKMYNLKERIDEFECLFRLYNSPDNIPVNLKKEEKEENQEKAESTDVSDVREEYERKLEKLKFKMKKAFNYNIATMQSEFDTACFNHTNELQKYKDHISTLSTQLWDVGEKLLVEKQLKEITKQKMEELRIELDNLQKTHTFEMEIKNRKLREVLSAFKQTTTKQEVKKDLSTMANVLNNEDELGEVFDTTCLADLRCKSTTDRLSVLQKRNSQCQPHLKSSYPGELQIYPVPFSEDEIKAGSASDEMFNDSLSQSLLTGKKVRRKDRTRDTPRKRRFSSIFRKSRMSLDHK